MKATFSAAEARRIALGAQGLAKPRPSVPPDARAIRATVERLGVVQIDSVNVVVRSHYLPLFSRLGAYDTATYDALAYGGKRRAFAEYWAHEASLIPLATLRFLRWRMERARRGLGTWSSLAALAERDPAFVESVYERVREHGPLRAAELGDEAKGTGSWWGWSDTKRALEYLYWSGRLTTATRRNFARLYDLPERVFPAHVLAAPTPPEPDAQRALVTIAARALGIATERDLRDYFRLDVADARARVAELAEAGELVAVGVRGWRDVAYVRPDVRVPRAGAAIALLSPFDSLVWDRGRAERLFGFRFRLEIYTPAHKREHGYYVLPFLMGERIAGRVDCKHDRATKTLRAVAAYAEADVPTAPLVEALAAELRRFAAWLGADHVAVGTAGDLASDLGRSLRSA
jgi:uncharacterized protein YcaQ